MAVAAVEGKVKHLNAKEVFGWTSEYLTRNGRPWFPVMGEFHYSRYPDRYWEESLYKMKACGVDVVSTYVIWIHHEKRKKEDMILPDAGIFGNFWQLRINAGF